MQQRSVLSWVLVGAFLASVSCSSDSSGTGPKGFGVACKLDADCAGYDLLCGDDSKCVQCLDENNCKSTESCSAGLCKTPDACKDSSQCSGGQVCQKTYGLCVDCITSKDCSSGEVCRQNKCGDPKACNYTSDCSDNGLLCDVLKHLCVTCRADKDCGLKETCDDAGDCVAEMASGGKGTGGTTSTGGKASGGSATGGNDAGGRGSGGKATGGTAAGGTTFGGSAGAGGKGGSAGSGGKAGGAGTGGGGTGGVAGCACVGGDVCTPVDERCVPPTLVDDLLDCDNQILEIEGRAGDWASAADTGISLSYDFSSPPSSELKDKTCAAWVTGTPISVPSATFAFIGFKLDQGLAYSLAAYNGLQIKLETTSMVQVQVVLKTIGGGYFQSTLAYIAGSNLRTATFASMMKMNNSAEQVLDPSKVYEIQFSVTEPSKAFGLAVHKVSLY